MLSTDYHSVKRTPIINALIDRLIDQSYIGHYISEVELNNWLLFVNFESRH